MREIGMTFCEPMILSLLEKRKFSTMRVIKQQPFLNPKNFAFPLGQITPKKLDSGMWCFTSETYRPHANSAGRCATTEPIMPKYRIGDRVYVKEAYKITHLGDVFTEGIYLADQREFCVQQPHEELERLVFRKQPYRHTSGRFMYKSLARIWLPEITSVEVKRPQDLTGAEILAEGIKGSCVDEGLEDLQQYFKELWNSLHSDGAWERNEWCWYIKWKEVEVK